jgi:hypothetical protein
MPEHRVIADSRSICVHNELLTAAMLATAGVPPEAKVLGLRRRLKCRSGRWRGRADVSVEWAPAD